MLTSTQELLETARRHAYAIGAFNVYNLEGVKAVIGAAEAHASPAMLQLHPSAPDLRPVAAGGALPRGGPAGGGAGGRAPRPQHLK